MEPTARQPYLLCLPQLNDVHATVPTRAVGALPLPPPPPPTAASQIWEAATLYVRVNGTDALLNAMLRDLMAHDIPVFGFEESVGNLEDIFLRTTKGLVQ